jgi:hypothetical protein
VGKAGTNPYAKAKLCLTPGTVQYSQLLHRFKHNLLSVSVCRIDIGGDFPTRKGFFDALHSGCVPVTFETTAALTQWPLHWQISVPGLIPVDSRDRDRTGDRHSRNHEEGEQAPHLENVASQCTVYIPRDVALRNMSDTFAYLVRLSADAEFMAAKRRCIGAVGFQLQYTLPGTSVKAVAGRRDALDVVLHHLLS